MIKQTLIAAALLGSNAIAQTVIYSEDFQSGLPVAYTIVDNDGLTPNAAVAEFADAWISLADPLNTADTVMGSTSYFEPVGQADRWLITPPIALGAYGNHAYWEARSHDPSFPDSYIVLVSTTDNQLTSFVDTLLLVLQETDEWTSRSGNLSEIGMDNETIYLAFVNQTNDGFKLYIDDIRVEIEDTAAIPETQLAQISTYPNPSSGQIQITGIQDIEKVSIYSMDGTCLMVSDQSVLNIEHLSNGRYILLAEGNQKVARTTIVKY